MNGDLRERLRLTDDEDLLNRVRRGMLTPEAHAAALEEIHARGYSIERLPTTPPDPVETEPPTVTASRVQSGLAWLKVAGILVLIGLGVRSCTTIANWDAFGNPGFRLFGDVLGSIGAFIILGAPAFALGWLFGGKKNNETG